MREITTYCYFARHESIELLLTADGTNAREEKMASMIRAELQSRTAGDGPVLVVTGGFHSIALPDLIKKESKVAATAVRTPDSVQNAVIRYSFEQLDALNGYSAGMPSPSYYDLLWREL